MGLRRGSALQDAGTGVWVAFSPRLMRRIFAKRLGLSGSGESSSGVRREERGQRTERQSRRRARSTGDVIVDVIATVTVTVGKVAMGWGGPNGIVSGVIGVTAAATASK